MRPVYLLDTCVVSEVSHQVPSETVMLELESKAADCVISSITWAELLYGCNLLENGRKKTALNAFLYEYVRETFDQLPFDEHAASILADLRARCRKTGKIVETADLMIASIAIANNVILVTRNIKHFEPLQEFSPLMLDNWWEDPAD